ncbi:hypothetical protein [Roseivirga sp. E12]|uniref:hypothetical protein n=1 Tax=Roseivirga sp. E12 TaxID=2819237 RepID=UPI001ABC76D5|nr:hypothetical protein [Roseivirga sp. E12]MBO3698071.1 hypothetical protein [Roseivirga sp. E12]
MKVLNETLASKSKSSWPKLRQEEVNNCFEIYDEQNEEYNRITGAYFGQVESSFLDAIENWNSSSSLSFCMGIDKNTDLFSPFFELMDDSGVVHLGMEEQLTKTFISPNTSKYQPHLGVSVDYKNEVCTNWALIPYYLVSRIFFQTISMDGSGHGISISGEEQLLKRPKRVKKFIIQTEDIDAMKSVLQPQSTIKVHFGVNYGHSANQQIAFTPVIEISNNTGLALDDEGDTFLDFVGACPPACPD